MAPVVAAYLAATQGLSGAASGMHVASPADGALIAAAPRVNTIEIFTLISVLATAVFMGVHCFVQIGCLRGALLLCREVGTLAPLAMGRLLRAIK